MSIRSGLPQIIRSYVDSFDPEDIAWNCIRVGRLGISAAVVVRAIRHQDSISWTSPWVWGTIIVWMCYTLFVAWTSCYAIRILEHRRPVASIRPLSPELQVLIDLLVIPIFYGSTGTPESDFFLFFFVPIFGSILSQRHWLALVAMVLTGIGLLISIVLARIVEIWLLRGGLSFEGALQSRLFANILLPRLAGFAFSGTIVWWVVTRSRRVRISQSRAYNAIAFLQTVETEEAFWSDFPRIVHRIGYRRCRLWQRVDTDRIKLRSVAGDRGEFSVDEELSLNEVTGEEVYRKKKILFYRYRWSVLQRLQGDLPWVVLDANESNVERLKQRQRIEEWVEVPIVSGEEVVGQLSIDNGDVGPPFHTSDLELLSNLSLVIESCLTRLRSYREVTKQVTMFKKMVEDLPIQVFLKDREGRFVFVNKRCAAMMRRESSDRILGKLDKDYFPDDLTAKYRRDDKFVMENEKVFSGHEEFEGPALNRRIPIRVVKGPWRNFHGKVRGVIGCFFEDEVLRGDIVRWFIHDTADPLMVMRDTVLRRIRQAIKQELDHDTGLYECTRCENIVDFVLATFHGYGFLGKKEKFSWDIEQTSVRVADLLNPVITVLEAVHQDVLVAVSSSIRQAKLKTDRHKVLCIVYQLLKNSIEAIESRREIEAVESEGVIDVDIERTSEGKLLLTLRDSGGGIDCDGSPSATTHLPENVDVMMESGKGWRIVSGFVALSGGSFKVRNVEGPRGMEAIIELPLQAVTWGSEQLDLESGHSASA